MRRFIPKRYDEYIDNNHLKSKFDKYLKSNKKIMLLIGDSGSGKTLFAHVISNEYMYDIIEINASMDRRKDSISKISFDMFSVGLNGKPKLLLLDEVDGLKNPSYLEKLIKMSNIPIIATANDKDNVSKTIKNMSVIVSLASPGSDDILKYLKVIRKKYNLSVNDIALNRISKVSISYRNAFNLLYVGVMDNNNFKGMMEYPIKDKISEKKQILEIMKGDGNNDNININSFKALKWFDSNITEFKDIIMLNRIIHIARKTRGVSKMSDWFSHNVNVSTNDYIHYPLWRNRKKKESDEIEVVIRKRKKSVEKYF